MIKVKNRLGVVGIVIEDREKVEIINDILHQSADIIVGRMGIPYKEKGISMISVMVDGTTDQVGSLTGKLGNIPGVNVKSALTK